MPPTMARANFRSRLAKPWVASVAVVLAFALIGTSGGRVIAARASTMDVIRKR